MLDFLWGGKIVEVYMTRNPSSTVTLLLLLVPLTQSFSKCYLCISYSDNNIFQLNKWATSLDNQCVELSSTPDHNMPQHSHKMIQDVKM